ncbi:MAG: outer membrane beta-barrel family protein [Muribaculaceae bacterium]|nr:outer membrane beta-barrel family protein [Muribaculaceae bacterium]
MVTTTQHFNRLTGIIIATLTATAACGAAEPTDSLTKELSEIVVAANQPTTRLEGSTLVSTIAGSRLQNIGTCLDVLAQLPMLSVKDSEVSVIGKGTPEILIDGRPLRDTDELTQLQSDNIRKVELSLSPGAMYASDTKAVLKITTRRNFLAGLSLTDRAEVTAKRRWSANEMLDLNYRTGAWEIFATGSIARNNTLTTGTTTNTLDYDGKTTVIGSAQHNTYPSVNGSAKAGFNYSKGEQSFGAYYRFGPERGDFANSGSEWIDDQPKTNRHIDQSIRSRSHLVSVYYDNTFAGRVQLHFDGTYRGSHATTSTHTIYPQSEKETVSSSDRSNSTLWAGKLYLRLPLFKGEFNIGTQGSRTSSELDYRMLNSAVESYIPSADTKTRQTAFAAFASWSRTFGRFSLAAGLRYEHVDYLFLLNGEKEPDLSRKDDLLTPDISLGWNFSDRAQISLSYKMATIKPPYSQLTGSLSYVGQHEIEGGNASLRDERMHDVQLFGMWNDFMLQADYTRSTDTYGFVKRVYPAPTLQLVMRPINLDVSAASLYLVWSRNIRAWTPNLTLVLYKQWLEIDGTKHNRPIYSYSFDNTLSLPRGFLLTANAYGQTGGDMHTNRFGTTWFSLDASIGKSFLKDSLRLKLSATDIFDTASNDWTMDTFGVLVDKRQRYDRRTVSVSLTYRLHPRKSKYKGEAASQEEMRRL